ncbi:MAG: glycosyltransferase [Bacteroidales bacterium]|nr:glycosyltransferase [Bacteroidales bacterium]
MKVSIIIPVYNVSGYIERCVDSVLCQTYSNIECIFVDDCSPDNSMELISKKTSSYSGNISFISIHHVQNKGLSGARNSGINASTGDYLYFLDSDDEIPERCIEELVRLAEKYQEVDIIQGSSEVIENGCLNKMYQLKGTLPEFSENHFWLKKNILERVLIPVTAWNKLIRRRFIIKNKMFFKEGLIHEDEHWTFFAAKSVKSMAFCKVPTYRHYIHEGTIMTSDSQKSISSWLFIIDDFVNGMDADMLRIQRKVILEVSFCNLIRIIRRSSNFSVGEMLTRQKEILKPCFRDALKRFQVFELFLLSYYLFPKCLLKFLCMDNIKGLYFRILKYLV